MHSCNLRSNALKSFPKKVIEKFTKLIGKLYSVILVYSILAEREGCEINSVVI